MEEKDIDSNWYLLYKERRSALLLIVFCYGFLDLRVAFFYPVSPVRAIMLGPLLTVNAQSCEQ